ncbi:hypothetical protein F5B17DRAFT_389101 [Nemania serpens]|nr:hypothetical protein F5B17DRAFT_389101 [Nemania serpens]
MFLWHPKPLLKPVHTLPQSLHVRSSSRKTWETNSIYIYIGAVNLTNLSNHLQAPPSAGPTMTLYDVNGRIDISQALQYPVGDPKRADATLLQRPPPPHPNPTATPALQTIRLFSLADPGYNPTVACEEPKDGDLLCGRNTKTSCRDLSHDASGRVPMPVCADCDQASRTYFEEALYSTAEMLRAYACTPCAARAAASQATYTAQKFHVWGLSSADPPSTPEEYASHDRCKPLPITGCACASKILDGTLCAAHRLEHLLDMRSKAQKMRDYVLQVFGRYVCPFCFLRAGADASQFESELGVASPYVAYACLACLGIVVLDAAAHETMPQGLQRYIEELEK